jgi:hypothetical protein
MKKLLLLTSVCFVITVHAQLTIDTLAFQDFEVTPAAPVWNFTGPVVYNSGYSGTNAAPANSPIGIGGSRAWETTSNSGGLILDFVNTAVPAGYDSVRVRFNLAAMNLATTGGGPDDLDYVLVAYSTDGGSTYSNRVRIRGAVANNSYWPYSATGVGNVYYLPASEQVFQPTNSGPQTTQGYSTVEIVFPGTVSQVALRITARSSSSSDTWLVDNLVMTGENICAPTSSTMSASACNSYTAPSGNVLTSTGTYMDTIANANGCDSVITINLVINTTTTATLTASSCTGNYTLPGGTIVTSSGTYMDTIPNAAGCDSVITANITVDSNTTAYFAPSVCFSLTLPSGTVVTASGIYTDTIINAAGCDSITTWDVFINNVDVTTTLTGATISSNATSATYQWIDCSNGNAIIAGETNQSFLPAANGDYAVIVTQGFCTDTSACISVLSVETNALVSKNISVLPNPASGVIVITGCTTGSVVSITDAQGRVIVCFTTQDSSAALDITSYAAGMYFVDIISGDEVIRKKIIKE